MESGGFAKAAETTAYGVERQDFGEDRESS